MFDVTGLCRNVTLNMTSGTSTNGRFPLSYSHSIKNHLTDIRYNDVDNGRFYPSRNCKEDNKMKAKQERTTGGLILIGVGLLALLGQFFDWAHVDFGLLIVPVIGVALLLVGIVTRNPGPMIPGGIMSGIGLGIFLVTGPFSDMPGDTEGGVFMLAFAAGWLLIVVATAVFTPQTHFWPLIPAAIMALIGSGVLYGDPFLQILALAGKLWPLALIVGGVLIINEARKREKTAVL